MTTPATRALPPWWAVLLVALAVIGAAFAIGRFSTFGSSAAATPTNDSAEAGFARDMQVHHTQAIEMAMTVYRKTQDDDIRMLSFDIATAQSGQKGEFFDWLVKWGLPQRSGTMMAWMDAADTDHQHAGDTTATEDELMTEMGMATPDQIAQLDAATGTDADCLFLELMITHHAGAIPMAEALLSLGSEPRALQVAQGVIDTQSAEIDLMRSLQSQLSCSD